MTPQAPAQAHRMTAFYLAAAFASAGLFGFHACQGDLLAALISGLFALAWAETAATEIEMKHDRLVELPPLPGCTHCIPYPGPEDLLYTAAQTGEPMESTHLPVLYQPIQLPPLTDAMYWAARGTELVDDDGLDHLWDAINTALRVSPSARARVVELLTPQAPAQALTEREQFEAWAETNQFATHCDESGKSKDYHLSATRWTWLAWQAGRAALPSIPEGAGERQRATALAQPSETVWLIEHSGELCGQKGGSVSWICVAPKFNGYGAQEFGYTHEAWKALHFARREDAEAVMKMHIGGSAPDWYLKPFSVTEHAFPSAAPPAPPEAQPSEPPNSDVAIAASSKQWLVRESKSWAAWCRRRAMDGLVMHLEACAVALAAPPAPEVPAPAEPSAWRPIETAPKDGKHLLLLAPTNFDKYTQAIACEGVWMRDFWVIFNADEAVQRVSPTGWMPLPPIPGTSPKAVPEAPSEGPSGVAA